MKNLNWYYVCDTQRMVATDYIQLPDVYGHISGFSSLQDGDLESLAWANLPHISLWPATRAINAGIDQASMAAVKANAAFAIREAGKLLRAVAVQNIVVTTSKGYQFQGDETSQDRMTRALTVLTATGIPTCPWVLADNTNINATAADLAEALALSGQAQAAVWVL